MPRGSESYNAALSSSSNRSTNLMEHGFFPRSEQNPCCDRSANNTFCYPDTLVFEQKDKHLFGSLGLLVRKELVPVWSRREPGRESAKCTVSQGMLGRGIREALGHG